MLNRHSRFRTITVVAPDIGSSIRLPVYHYFAGGPFHEYTIVGYLDITKLREELSGSLISSDTRVDPSDVEEAGEYEGKLMFHLEDGVFCQADDDRLTIFASSLHEAMNRAQQLYKRYRKPKVNEPEFFLLKVEPGEIAVESVKPVQPIVLNEADLALHYGDDIIAFERRLIDAFKSRIAGATILRGEPGTGKTSFIRHLIAKLQNSHRFYYLPLSACEFLAGPDMVNFWLRQSRQAPDKKKVVILEDAEDLLAIRGPDNKAKLACLLNISDGLLGEFLHVHLICTVNSRIDQLDPAVVRPGRLVAHREFKRLSPDQARRLAEAKGLELVPDQAEYSLAEIYQPNQWTGEPPRGSMGFTSGRSVK